MVRPSLIILMALSAFVLSASSCAPAPDAVVYDCFRNGRNVEVRLWLANPLPPDSELFLFEDSNVLDNIEQLDHVPLAVEADTVAQLSGRDMVSEGDGWRADFELPSDDIGDRYILIIIGQETSGMQQILLAERIQDKGPK